MSTYSFTGCVTKAPLLLAPAVARERELVQYIKFRLYEEGFVIVREECRLLNREMAEKLCVLYDQAAISNLPPSLTDADSVGRAQDGQPLVTAGITADSSGHDSSGTAVSIVTNMIGSAYIFIVAHRDCHARLCVFTETLRTEDETYRAFLEQVLTRMEAKTVSALRLSPSVWTSRTAVAARQIVAALFPQMVSQEVPTAVQSRDYVQANLKIALLPALAELSRLKPEEPLRWLAERLLETNTQAPPMQSHGTL